VRYVAVDTPASSSSRPDAWALAGGLPFADGSFETVLCTQVIEHLAEPGAALGEIARVLAPGGRLILTAPQQWFLHEEPFDFYRFTRFGLQHLCARAGLAAVEVRSQGGFWAMAGIYLPVHAGSYVRWLAERGQPAPVVPGETPTWRRVLWPLRLPLALWNLLLGALDALPQPGIFALNHLIVASKPGPGD
jgi:SAM-dependent methyltransferase